MNLLDALNPAQQEAVQTTNGPVLVLAGAGSGKTRVLTYRVAHLIRDCGVPPYRILAFTFTNKAAGEMKERLSGLLDGVPRDMWVGTFHATGVRILRQQGSAVGIEPGFSIFDTDDQDSLLRRILKDKNLGDRDFTPRIVRAAISSAKNQLMTADEFAAEAESFRQERIAEVFGEYEKRLLDSNAMDFDDLIGKPLELFDKRPDIRDLFADRFEYVMVDEYQDTNPAQSRLIEALSGKYRNLCVVGDDDQSIYGWRGADIKHILSFSQTFPQAKVVRLEQNYRSTKNIIEAANAVVINNRYRNQKQLWTEREAGDLLTLTVVGDEEEEARYVVAAALQEIEKRDLSRRDVAVLYRTNAQSRALEGAFRNAGVPYELVGGTAFYQRKEIKDLLAYLRLLVNPLDNVAFTRVVNTPKRGIGGTTLDRLALHAEREEKSLLQSLESIESAPEFRDAARKKLKVFESLVEEFAARAGDPVDEVLSDLVERLDFRGHLQQDEPHTAEDRIENVDEMIAGARLFVRNNEQGDVHSFLNEVLLLTSADSAEETQERVRLMTIHNAKGLEFPVVLAPGLEEALLPHVSSMDSDEELEEERRLFYVALTRAQDQVHLFAAKTRQRWGAGSGSLLSRFVQELPEPLLVVNEVAPSWGSSWRSERVERSRAAEYQELDAGPRRSLGTVVHPTFGRGDVLSQEGTGPDARLVVLFQGNLKKKIVARYAQWEESHADW